MGYLLLRDNKQTGPYSTEELIAKGFKPYDLIWSEGKSAGWRYPSELPEFVAHAPVVEEQPFDRFYKKSNQVAGSHPALSASRNETSFSTSPPVMSVVDSLPAGEAKTIVKARITEPVNEPEIKTVAAKVVSLPSRKVFVTMPGSTVVPSASKAPQAPAHVHADESRYMPKPAKAEPVATVLEQKPEVKPVPSSAIDSPRQVNSVKAVNEFVNDRLNTIPASEAVYPSQMPKRNTAMLFLRTAVAACLILGGVIIGLLISKTKQSPEQEQLNARLQQIKDRNAGKTEPSPTQQLDSPLPMQPVASNGQVDALSSELKTGEANTSENRGSNADNIAKTAVIKEPASPTTDIAKSGTSKNVAATSSEVTQVEVERKQAPVANEAARKNIYELVSVSGSEYKVGVLGGISNLQLTISNNSLYPIDQLEVSLNYMNVEKKVVRKETLYVNDVAAGEHKTIPVPKSKRGVTVSYSITRINSRALGLAHSGL